MFIEIEKIANSLKGVASVLSTMSEVPKGSMIWNEWALNCTPCQGHFELV